MLEIDIDIGGLVAFPGDEPFEKRVDDIRPDIGDFQAIANNGIGGRAAPLTQNILRSGIFDDVVDGQEITRVVLRRSIRRVLLDTRVTEAGHPAG